MTDEQFRAAYGPLHVPAHFDKADTQENKIIYALAQLGQGAVTDVIGELDKLEPGILNAQMIAMVKTVLSGLYDKGLLSGRETNGIMKYNFQKMTSAHSGEVHNAVH